MMKFAQELPRIKCLKRVHLNLNPWEGNDRSCKDNYEERCAALLQGLLVNYSLEFLNMSRNRNSPVEILLQYYCNLNRAGRRILATPSTNVPVGLWPRILERAGKDKYNVWDMTSIEATMQIAKYRANAIFFFLQNCTFLTRLLHS